MRKARLRDNLDRVIWKIEQARVEVSEHHIVKLVAVGKYSDEESIKLLYELGQRAFGENQVQQLEQRIQNLGELPLEWHMIGTLQSNKINKLLNLRPALLQSLDSLKLAQAINRRLEARGESLNALLQINSAREETKSGVTVEEAEDVYAQILEECPNIRLRGVMSIGALSEDKKTVQQSFETTYKIYEKFKKDGATICSMGMSGDYELAIKCGSNLVRIGSEIFK
ncbi:MAG: YggS family pyridoxal phosphate-dependent enzyme [Epsilonproteobacteria bacterium]|nr:YggS family pyridoxal phosphate-dependent enzyme [Campylobacterota bacterium]